MTTPIEAVRDQLGALDQRLAREHAENREVLKGQDAKLDALVAKIDQVKEVGWRHDEQIKTLQKGGGGALSIIITIIGGIVLDRLRR